MAGIYNLEGEGLPLHVNAEIESASLAAWWPNNPPIYDINKTYLENAQYGPFFKGAIPKRQFPREETWVDFLGFKVARPLGIPAGPLLNSAWIGLAGSLGFDILVYKTIRSASHLGHGLPNMVYVDCKQQLMPNKYPEALYTRSHPPESMEDIAVTNSFGMPSRDPEYLANDIPKAQSLLQPGQVIVVSVVGTATGEGMNAFVEDFVRVSCQAADYGAKIIELNLSCPNVTTGEGSIYHHPDIVYEIVSKIVKAIPTVPVIIKVGVFEDLRIMEQTFLSAAKAGARAVSGINTISMKVWNHDNTPALGVNRIQSGICGSPIRDAAIEFTRAASQINKKNKLGLTIMTTGGAVLPAHFSDFFEAGADVAMTATGMMWDPYIAINYQR